MSRKTDFEHYIAKATSLKEIRAKGQGEEERVIRAGIVQAAHKGNAVALTALFPLITCKDEFLDDVLRIVFNGKHDRLELIKAIPKNTAGYLPHSKWLRTSQTTSDDAAWGEMVRIFDLNEYDLRGMGVHAARLNCEATVAQVLRKNKRLGSDILIEAWTNCSEHIVDLLIPTILNLERFSESLKRSYQFYGQAQRMMKQYTYIQSALESHIAQRQNNLLAKSIDSKPTIENPIAKKTRKM